MLNRYLTSSFLAAAVLSLGMVGCDRSGGTTSTTEGPGERTGRAVDNAARNTADAAHDAANRTSNAANNAADRTANTANNAADRAAGATDTYRPNATVTGTNNTTTGNTTADNTAPRTTDSKVPGMPSVTGTSTSNMSTADAAAQRLIDNARKNLQDNDVSKAKTLVAELKDKGMYDSLSAQQKANVDKLEQDVNSKATAQETK